MGRINRKVSSSMSAVLQTMLAKDPAHRYSTARDVLVDLRRVQHGEDPVFAHGAVPRKKSRSKLLLKLAIVVAIPALVVAAAFFVGSRMQRGANGSNLAVSPSAQTTGEKSATLVVL